MSTMRAAIIYEHGEREVVKLEQIDIPQLGVNDVRIRVHACGLNWLDVGIRRGPKFGAIPLPIITGSDISGTIDAVGDNVVGWNEGDEVTVYPLLTCGKCEYCRQGELTVCPEHQIIGEHVNGGLAEYVIVPEHNLIRKPSNLTHVQVASLPVVTMTAWHMLITVANLQTGEMVFIPGAGGGVASMGIQIAKHAGAIVYTTTSTPQKMQLAQELGADFVFNYHDDDWVEQVIAATGGRGVDLAQDNVGAKTWANTLKTLARNGKMVVCGSHSGTNFDLAIPQIYHRQLSILGANGGTYNELSRALAVIDTGQIKPVVDKVLRLDQIHEGHRILEEHDHFGKVVIDVT